VAKLYDAFGKAIRQTNALMDDIHNAVVLEWWRGASLVKSMKLNGIDGWARDIALKYWHDQPRERWDSAVIQCRNGARMQTQRRIGVPLWAGKDAILAALTNSNTYVGPNFDLDTSTGYAGLVALKGSAPAGTDLIYEYNGITLTIADTENLNCLLITIGSTKSGAASAGQKYAILRTEAGSTLTFAGNATSTNSGIKSSPTTPGAESLNCKWQCPGTAAKHITLTNGSTLDTAKRWTVNMTYGNVNGAFVDAVNFWNLFLYLNGKTSNSAAPDVLNDVTCTPVGSVSGSPIQFIATGMNREEVFQRWTIDTTPALLSYLCQSGTTVAAAAGFSLDVSGCKTAGVSANVFCPVGWRNGTMHVAQMKIAFSDIRPTTVVPATFTLTDPGTNGELRWTISNAASYAATDEINVHTDAGLIVGCTQISKYLLDGYGVITGLTNGVLQTLKARSTSDNNTYSAYSATATGTPTSPIAAAITVSSVTNVGSTVTLACLGAGATEGWVRITTEMFSVEIDVTSWSDSTVVGTITKSMRAGTYQVIIESASGAVGTGSLTLTDPIEVTTVSSEVLYKLTTGIVNRVETEIPTLNVSFNETTNLLQPDLLFPRLEIELLKTTGSGYASQRQIEMRSHFLCVGYIKKTHKRDGTLIGEGETPEPFSLTEIQGITNLGKHTMAVVYGLKDDQQSGAFVLDEFMYFEGTPELYFDFELIPGFAMFAFTFVAVTQETDTQY
jgi:hypothetical protein